MTVKLLPGRKGVEGGQADDATGARRMGERGGETLKRLKARAIREGDGGWDGVRLTVG